MLILTVLFMIQVGFIVPVIWTLFAKFLLSISFVFMNDYFGVGAYWGTTGRSYCSGFIMCWPQSSALHRLEERT